MPTGADAGDADIALRLSVTVTEDRSINLETLQASLADAAEENVEVRVEATVETSVEISLLRFSGEMTDDRLAAAVANATCGSVSATCAVEVQRIPAARRAVATVFETILGDAVAAKAEVNNEQLVAALGEGSIASVESAEFVRADLEIVYSGIAEIVDAAIEERLVEQVSNITGVPEGEISIPTAAPTAAPTSAPTGAPRAAPTAMPTAGPTVAPTSGRQLPSDIGHGRGVDGDSGGDLKFGLGVGLGLGGSQCIFLGVAVYFCRRRQREAELRRGGARYIYTKEFGRPQQQPAHANEQPQRQDWQAWREWQRSHHNLRSKQCSESDAGDSTATGGVRSKYL